MRPAGRAPSGAIGTPHTMGLAPRPSEASHVPSSGAKLLVGSAPATCGTMAQGNATASLEALGRRRDANRSMPLIEPQTSTARRRGPKRYLSPSQAVCKGHRSTNSVNFDARSSQTEVLTGRIILAPLGDRTNQEGQYCGVGRIRSQVLTVPKSLLHRNNRPKARICPESRPSDAYVGYRNAPMTESLCAIRAGACVPAFDGNRHLGGNQHHRQ